MWAPRLQVGRVPPSGSIPTAVFAAGRLSTQTAPAGKTITYTYDAVGNRATMVDPDGGTTTYSFDAGRRLSSLVNPLAERTTWQYDPVGRITTLTHANATRAVHTYNAAGWVTGLVNAKSDGTTLTSHDYAYDALGSPTSMVDAGGDRTTWTYDALSRLTRERRSGTNAYDLTYTYDPVGNRATRLTGGVTTTYTYDAADELTAANAGGTRTTFTYDNDGNALTQNAAGTWTTMTWGYEDELKTIQSGGATATITYDGDFMRRKRQEGAATANFIWDGTQVLAETDGSNATVVRYTLAPFGFGDLVAQRRSAATHWYHFDALGSTRALTDSGAAVTDTALYQAFGTPVASSGSTVNPHSWVGRLGYATEARLSGYLLRRRHYSDGVGRFLSRDPMGGQVGDYLYVGQRPTRAADPGGEEALPYFPPSPGLVLVPPEGVPPPTCALLEDLIGMLDPMALAILLSLPPCGPTKSRGPSWEDQSPRISNQECIKACTNRKRSEDWCRKLCGQFRGKKTCAGVGGVCDHMGRHQNAGQYPPGSFRACCDVMKAKCPIAYMPKVCKDLLGIPDEFQIGF
jgi:RHS repeat-associated protein